MDQNHKNIAQKLLVGIILLVIAYVIYKQWYPTPEKQMGYQGPSQCEKDADCPDATHCANHGYCIPNVSNVGYTDPTGILGRGRGGEGENVVNIGGIVDR